jgi:predicted RNA binding protein YcfA (HicA-like mRNA interferase family)
MSKKQKLIERLRLKPRDFTFEEMESLLLSLGFKKSNKGRTSGSRVLFELGDVSIDLHKPHPQKELPMYQIKKILRNLQEEELV